MFEIYLGIVAFGYETSKWVALEDLNPPWPTNQAGPLPGIGILQWFKVLLDNGFQWEASRVLRALLPALPSLPPEDVSLLVLGDEQPWFEIDSNAQDEPDKPALVAMNLTRAHFILDRVIRYRLVDAPALQPTLERHYEGYEEGRDYLLEAYGQAIDRSKSVWDPGLDIALEEAHYSFMGGALEKGIRKLPNGEMRKDERRI